MPRARVRPRLLPGARLVAALRRLPAAVAIPAALAPGAVLAFDPGGRSPFGPAKWLAVPVLVLLAFAATAGGGAGRVGRRTVVAWGVFLGWVVVAAAAGVDRWPAWIGTAERRFGGLTWAICALAHLTGHQLDERARRAVAVAGTFAVGVTGVVVLGELLGWRAVTLAGAGDRPVGTLGSSAILGAALALLLPLAAGVAVAGRQRWPVAGAAGLGVVALVASGARAAWVGVVVAAVVVAAVRRPRIHRPARALAVAVVAAAALVGLAAATGVTDRTVATFTTADGGARGRLDEWRVAARVVAAHPVTGVGPEGYRIAFGRAVDERYEKIHGRDPIPDRAHDVLLDVAATTGLPGLALFLAVVVLAGRSVLRSLRHGDPVVVGLGAGVVAYATQAMFLFPLGELDPLAWLLAGATAAATARNDVRTVAPALVPARAVAAALAVALAAVGVAGVVADRRARRGDGAGAAALRPDVPRYHLDAAAEEEAIGSSASLDRALSRMADARRRSPDDPAVRSEWTRLLLQRAQRTGSPRHVATARAALEDLANRLDPRNAEVLLRLGVARSLAGDDAGAESAWLEAERLAPRSAAASLDLALAYARQRRLAEAERAARRALARDPGNDDAEALLRRLAEEPGT